MVDISSQFFVNISQNISTYFLAVSQDQYPSSRIVKDHFIFYLCVEFRICSINYCVPKAHSIVPVYSNSIVFFPAKPRLFGSHAFL